MIRKQLHAALDKLLDVLPQAEMYEMELLGVHGDVCNGATAEVDQDGIQSNCTFTLSATDRCATCGAALAIDEEEGMLDGKA